MIFLVLGSIVILVFCYFLFKILPLKANVVISVSVVCILLSFYLIHRSNFFVKSMDLKSEALNEMHLGDEITPLLLKELKNNYGEIVNDSGMAILLSSENDHSFKFEKLYLGVMNNRVNSIVSENSNITTSKGVSIGDNMTTVKELYGPNFISSLDEIGETITYIDKDRDLLLQFVVDRDKVFQIIFTTN